MGRGGEGVQAGASVELQICAGSSMVRELARCPWAHRRSDHSYQTGGGVGQDVADHSFALWICKLLRASLRRIDLRLSESAGDGPKLLRSAPLPGLGLHAEGQVRAGDRRIPKG